jgi:hypothetical protein
MIFMLESGVLFSARESPANARTPSWTLCVPPLLFSSSFHGRLLHSFHYSLRAFYHASPSFISDFLGRRPRLFLLLLLTVITNDQVAGTIT